MNLLGQRKLMVINYPTMTVFLYKMTKKCLNFCSATKKYCDNTGWGLCNVIAPSDTAPSIENISIDIIKNIWYTSIPPHPPYIYEI